MAKKPKKILKDWYITENLTDRELHGTLDGEPIEPEVVKDVTEKFSYAWCEKSNYHLTKPVY
jgi:hypothetical protein